MVLGTRVSVQLLHKDVDLQMRTKTKTKWYQIFVYGKKRATYVNFGIKYNVKCSHILQRLIQLLGYYNIRTFSIFTIGIRKVNHYCPSNMIDSKFPKFYFKLNIVNTSGSYRKIYQKIIKCITHISEVKNGAWNF